MIAASPRPLPSSVGRGAGLLLLACALALPSTPALAQSSGTVTRTPPSDAGSDESSGTGTTSGTSSGSSTTSSTTTSGTTRSGTTSSTSGSSSRSSASGTGSSSAAGQDDARPRSGGTLLGGQQDPDEELGAHEEDDGRAADFLWIEVEGGISYVNLVAFQQQQFSGGGMTTTVPGFTEVEGTGPMVGVGLGFRVFWFALGGRATLASYPGFEIGTVGGEITLRLPVPVVEPWFRVGAGYAWQGNANYTTMAVEASSTTVYGWNVYGALGLDIFFTWWFTLGVGVQMDVLNMTRQSDPTVDCMGVTDFCPMQDGDAVGAQARGFITAGLHF